MITVLPDRVIGPGSAASFEPKMRGIEVTLQGIIRVWMGNFSWPAVDGGHRSGSPSSRRTTRSSGTTQSERSSHLKEAKLSFTRDLLPAPGSSYQTNSSWRMDSS